MGKNKINRIKENDLLQVRQNYLSAAISDISGYIHLMDTKVSIIMAAQGVIIAGLLSIYDNLIDAIELYHSILEKSVVLISVSGFIVFTILVYVYGLKTIFARTVTANRTTSWFLNAGRIQNGAEKYLEELNAKSEEELLDDMAIELFKLNDINLKKMKLANMTVKLFIFSLVFLMTYIIQFILIHF